MLIRHLVVRDTGCRSRCDYCGSWRSDGDGGGNIIRIRTGVSVGCCNGRCGGISITGVSRSTGICIARVIAIAIGGTVIGGILVRIVRGDCDKRVTESWGLHQQTARWRLLVVNFGIVVIGTNTEVQGAAIVGYRGTAIIDTCQQGTLGSDDNFVVGSANADGGEIGYTGFIRCAILLADAATDGAETTLEQFERGDIATGILFILIGDEGEFSGFFQGDQGAVDHANLGRAGGRSNHCVAFEHGGSTRQGAVSSRGIDGADLASHGNDVTGRFGSRIGTSLLRIGQGG